MSVDLRVTHDQIGTALTWLRANKPFFMERGFSEEVYEDLLAFGGVCDMAPCHLSIDDRQPLSFNSGVKSMNIPYCGIFRMTRGWICE
jgi:hypothetical protein